MGMSARIDEGLPLGVEKSILLYKTEYKSKGNYICKINGKTIGTGFFSKIKYEKNLIPVLITNYHVVDDDFMNQNKKLKFYINDDSYIVDINSESKIYSSIRNKYDMMIIKLKEGEINNYLEIDENIFKDNSEKNYENEGIYILHYANVGEAKISFGKGLEKLNDYDIKHLCHTEAGSSGGPILSRMTNKVIGIHKGSIDKFGKCLYNIGTFLKFPLNEFIKKNKSIINGSEGVKVKKILKVSNYYFII